MKQSNFFHKQDLITKLNNVVDKTLGEVDVNSIFDKTITKPKITGIAGDVIEQSVLGYPPDGEQRPDLDVDGTLTELKTTGIRKKKVDNKWQYEAKEPASVTAVSIGTIEDETFDTSAFWAKVANTLFVFYEYESEKTVLAAEYKDFHIRGYTFHSFQGNDLDIIRSDWQLIHDFLCYIRDNFSAEEAKEKYPDLSSVINKKTVYLDTAPKYPHPPRFRLRRRVVSSIVQETFDGASFEKIPGEYDSYGDIINKCSQLTQLYRGLSMYELLLYFGFKNISKNGAIKQYAEQVIVRMFGGSSKKLSKIELFRKFGVIGKSITVSEKGGRTEDMKLFPVDFDELAEAEILDEDTGVMRDKCFEDSELYSYLTENKLLCIMFQEVPDSDGVVHLENNIFMGFKFVDLSKEEILQQAKESWETARHLIRYDELKVEHVCTKEGFIRYTPKTKIPMTASNLPKSKDNIIFFRGTGTDAADKINVNGLEMLRQDYWIKGSFLVETLKASEQIHPSNIIRINNERKEVLDTIKRLKTDKK